MDKYAAQNERYKKGLTYLDKIDPVAAQKMALLFGFLPFHAGARVADLGCARGEGSAHLARMNPHIKVVGIDNNPDNIAQARATFAAIPNLSFSLADIRNLSPEREGYFSGLLLSSVLHHVYSYNGYDVAPVRETLRSCFSVLAMNGIMAMRDFVRPRHDLFAFLDLPHDRIGQDPVTMSAADLLVHFSRTARALAAPQDRGFYLKEVEEPEAGWRRFWLPLAWGHEFAWRESYRTGYDGEAMERYAFLMEEEGWRAETALRGARIVHRGPFNNQWIEFKNWRGKMRFWDKNKMPLPFPSTNYVCVLQKVGPERSFWVGEAFEAREENRNYLTIKSYRHIETGRIYDMVSRPGGVADVLPYLYEDGVLRVVGKGGYPRPLVNAQAAPSLDGRSYSGHFTEILALANRESDAPLLDQLGAKSGLVPETMGAPESALTYYPAAGFADEMVGAFFVPLRGQGIQTQNGVLHIVPPEVSGFSTGGDVRLLDAQNLLRAAQVGVLSEARFELNIYALMRRLGVAPEAHADREIFARLPAPSDFETHEIDALLAGPARQLFEPSPVSAGYLTHKRSVFEDRSFDKQLARRSFEFVLPAQAAAHGVAALPLARNGEGDLCVGLMPLDLPAPQLREGSSAFLAAPVYRLPFGVETLFEARHYVARKMEADAQKMWRVGEGFFSSVGMTPDRLYPFSVPVAPKAHPDLAFVRLKDAFVHLEKLRDAPAMIGALRLVHLTGMWEECAAARRAYLKQAGGRLTFPASGP